jgi:hypothetical protein
MAATARTPKTSKTAQPAKKRRRVPPTPPPKPQPKYYMIRITPDLIARVEDLRPQHIPREPFIRHLLSLQLDEMEEQAA